MKYVELHARSAFSFLRGAATPEELIAVCAELKMPAMALLDNDGLYGAARRSNRPCVGARLLRTLPLRRSRRGEQQGPRAGPRRERGRRRVNEA